MAKGNNSRAMIAPDVLQRLEPISAELICGGNGRGVEERLTLATIHQVRKATSRFRDLLGSAITEEDLQQEALLELFLSLKAFEGTTPGALVGFIRAIVTRKINRACMNLVAERKKQTSSRPSLEEKMKNSVYEVPNKPRVLLDRSQITLWETAILCLRFNLRVEVAGQETDLAQMEGVSRANISQMGSRLAARVERLTSEELERIGFFTYHAVLDFYKSSTEPRSLKDVDSYIRSLGVTDEEFNRLFVKGKQKKKLKGPTPVVEDEERMAT